MERGDATFTYVNEEVEITDSPLYIRGRGVGGRGGCGLRIAISTVKSDTFDEIQPSEGRTEPADDDRVRPSRWRHRHTTTVRMRTRKTGCQNR